MSIFDRTFVRRTLERGIKTVAQTAAALLVAAGPGPLDIDFPGVAAVAGLAGLVSVLTSIGSGYVGDDSPSLVD